MSQATVSVKTYALTWAGLLGLTLVTSLLGLVDLGRYSILVAVLIATMKAALIASFFMHALYETKLVRVVLAGGLVWFLIMLTITLVDYLSRGWLPFPGK